MKAIRQLRHYMTTLGLQGISIDHPMYKDVVEAIKELENFKADYDKINDAWVDCVERYESVLNKQIIKEKQTCENCKHYVELVRGASETICCILNFDCIRKYEPKDRWESKE